MNNLDDAVRVCLCHDEIHEGAATPDGWTERRLAGAVNEAVSITLREFGVPCWQMSSGTLASRIAQLKTMHHAPVVEVHFDSLPQRTEVAGYYAIVDNSNVGALMMADSILRAIADVCPDRRNLGVCRTDEESRWIGTGRQYSGQRLGLLRELRDRPVVIIEGCYLTNPTEAKWIKRIENRLTLGAAIGRGIALYRQRSTEPSPAA
jgi:hypothetical protein